ncbi:MAG: multidrug effflux MFS transporter, partial [bacterium]|nr:multidrug effflux MFS transporter [bacterium]
FRRTRQLDQLLTTEVAANSDERPIAYALNLRRWLREVGVNPQLLERTVRMADTGVGAVRRRGVLCTSAAAVVLTVALVLVARNRRRGARKVTLAVAVATSGWAGMMGELAIVFMYQNAFGRLYHAIGGLFAVYMLGLAAGSKLTSGRAFTMVSIRVLMICSSLVGLALSPSHSSVALFAVLFCYAFALGMEYPVANRLYLREGGSAAAGVLHGMDHLGAAVATWIGGTLLLPWIGARSILVAVVAVHLVVLGPLALLFRVGR